MDIMSALQVTFLVACCIVPLLLFLATSRSHGALLEEKILWVGRESKIFSRVRASLLSISQARELVEQGYYKVRRPRHLERPW